MKQPPLKSEFPNCKATNRIHIAIKIIKPTIKNNKETANNIPILVVWSTNMKTSTTVKKHRNQIYLPSQRKILAQTTTMMNRVSHCHRTDIAE